MIHFLQNALNAVMETDYDCSVLNIVEDEFCATKHIIAGSNYCGRNNLNCYGFARVLGTETRFLSDL